MLNKEEINDLIEGRMSHEQACRFLQHLAPPHVDLETIIYMVEYLQTKIANQAFDQLAGAEAVIDCSGTGGSGLSHYNTSTTTAFVLAAGQVKVAKFGNRASNSACGSFDLLEALGIPVQVSPPAIKQLLETTNLVFLFARQFYPELGTLAAARKAVAGPTVFNTIGPLLNPMRPRLRLLGTASQSMQDLISAYLAQEGKTERAFIVTANSGLDELDPISKNRIMRIGRNGEVREEFYQYDCPSLSISRALSQSSNAEIFQALIKNEESASYYRELVCLNAGAGFVVAGKVQSIEEGRQLASELLASGEVLRKFEESRRVYASLAC